MARRASKPAPSHADWRLVVLHGAEAFLIAQHTRAVRDALRARHGEVQTTLFDGNAAQAADVLDECRSFGLLASHKLVVVDAADQFVKESNRPLVERYAQAPGDGATLILRAAKWNPGKLDAMIEQVGTIIACDPLKDAAAREWLRDAAARHGTRIDEHAAERLVERLGTDLGRLDGELAKLAIAAGPGGDVTRALVDEMVGKSREEKTWAVQSALLAGSAERGVEAVRDLIEVSRAAPTAVGWSMTDLARKLHTASALMRQGVRGGDLFRPLQLWGDVGGPLLSAAGRAEPSRLRRLFRDALEIDARNKSGLGDAARSLERLAVRFALALGHVPPSR